MGERADMAGDDVAGEPGELSPVEKAARTAVLALRRMRVSLDDVDVALSALAASSGDEEAPELFRQVADALGTDVMNAVDVVTLVLGRQALAVLLAPEMDAEEDARGPRDVRDRMTAADTRHVRTRAVDIPGM